jgi:cell wall-associated NlpC family hydrolase
MRFKGNPYVWGGTSLTRGADCSGFTQSVLKNFGILIPRTSRQQSRGGRRVSMDKIQPGDLIFYRKNGVVNHVAMYIGNGKVIGAASRKEGITIKNYNYRTPYKAVSYINR